MPRGKPKRGKFLEGSGASWIMNSIWRRRWSWRRKRLLQVRCLWAVIVVGGEIVGRGRNRREEKQEVFSHAEMEAITDANHRLGSWRLEEASLYVTLEPCPMCAGAIINGRVRRVFYGARDSVMGACGGVLNLFMENFPVRPALVGGILAEDCRAVLREFFAGLRKD